MNPRARFDQPWKQILARLFRDFLELLLPDAAGAIAWKKGYEILDKELAALALLTEEKANEHCAVDMLVKVHLEDGGETWVLVHVEVQMQPVADLAERIYAYAYRAFDRHRRRVASIAVLGDRSPGWRPGPFSYDLLGTSLGFRFPVVKLLDFEDRREELEASRNPFSRVILIHLAALRTRDAPLERLRWKRLLFRDLISQGYERELVRALFRFLDRIMTMSKPLEKEFRESAARDVEDLDVPFLSNIEIEAMEEGIQRGLQQGLLQGTQNAILQALAARFGAPPQSLADHVRAISDPDVLLELHRQAVIAPTLAAFEAAALPAVPRPKD